MSTTEEQVLDDDINIIDDIVTREEDAPEATPEAPKEDETPETEPAGGEQEVQQAEEEEEPAPETPVQLTEDGLRSIMSDLRREEQESSKKLDEIYQDIQSRYYPQGVSRILTDSKTGLEIRTAQDVLDLSENPDLTIEEAERWRLVKQAELDAQVQEIESTTRQIAEQTLALERGAERVQQKYADLFKAHPALERQVTAQYMKTVSIDKETSTILSAPIDIEEFYSMVLEPYSTAYTAQVAAPTQPEPAPVVPTPAPTPSKDDRLDEHGDGGSGDDGDADPDDFEAQLKKEFNS